MKAKFGYLNYTNIMRFLVVGIFIGLVVLFGLIFIPFKTIEFNNEPFPITNAPVHAGESVSYRIDYCRFTDKPARFTRTLEGPTLVTLVHSESTSDRGCRVVDVVNTVVPTSVKPGTYTLKINICVKPNYFQDRCQLVRSQPFEILEVKRDKDGNPILLNETPTGPTSYVVDNIPSVAYKEKPLKAIPKAEPSQSPVTPDKVAEEAEPKPAGHVNKGNDVVQLEVRISPVTGLKEYRAVGDRFWLLCNGLAICL